MKRLHTSAVESAIVTRGPNRVLGPQTSPPPRRRPIRSALSQQRSRPGCRATNTAWALQTTHSAYSATWRTTPHSTSLAAPLTLPPSQRVTSGWDLLRWPPTSEAARPSDTCLRWIRRAPTIQLLWTGGLHGLQGECNDVTWYQNENYRFTRVSPFANTQNTSYMIIIWDTWYTEYDYTKMHITLFNSSNRLVVPGSSASRIIKTFYEDLKKNNKERILGFCLYK